MDTPDIARTLLSHLAVRGVSGDDVTGSPGRPAASPPGGTPAVVLVLQGVLARRRAGSAVSLGLAGAGEAIGLEGPDDGAVWLTPGRAARMPLSDILAIDPGLLAELRLADLETKAAALRREVLRHARLTLVQRLAALLHDIHDRGGERMIALRQTDLADLLHVRRAGVSNAAAALQAAGAVRLHRGGIEVADIVGLSAVAAVRAGLTPP